MASSCSAPVQVTFVAEYLGGNAYGLGIWRIPHQGHIEVAYNLGGLATSIKHLSKEAIQAVQNEMEARVSTTAQGILNQSQTTTPAPAAAAAAAAAQSASYQLQATTAASPFSAPARLTLIAKYMGCDGCGYDAWQINGLEDQSCLGVIEITYDLSLLFPSGKHLSKEAVQAVRNGMKARVVAAAQSAVLAAIASEKAFRSQSIQKILKTQSASHQLSAPPSSASAAAAAAAAAQNALHQRRATTSDTNRKDL